MADEHQRQVYETIEQHQNAHEFTKQQRKPGGLQHTPCYVVGSQVGQSEPHPILQSAQLLILLSTIFKQQPLLLHCESLVHQDPVQRFIKVVILNEMNYLSN
ncbi:Hypothetical_protein [Hexamita inflata]|uniref:Hypothetical_protein n=1 Tax=Hexamita inflata TaxID=28002 RepID=A0ABP1K2C2_9EUKA